MANLVSELRKMLVAGAVSGVWNLFCLVLQLGFVGLLGLVAVYLLWSGMVWAFWRVIEAIASVLGVPYTVVFGTIRLAWHWIAPPQETAAEKFNRVVGSVGTTIYESAEKPVVQVDRLIGWTNILSVLMWALVLIIGWLLLARVFQVVRKQRLRARGLVVSGEAMNSGSSFIVAEGPSGVVKIMSPGFTWDSLAGLGGRVGDWLVLPGHVYQMVNGDDGLLLKGLGEEPAVPVRGSVRQSRLYSDVMYVRIPVDVWARLKVSRLSKAGLVLDSLMASVWGHKGKSVGTVGRMENPEFLFYTGSTVPGYSGAMYFSAAGSWLGMHLGAVTGKSTNVGARADVIAKEVQCLEVEYQAINPEGFRRQATGSEASSGSSTRNGARQMNRKYDDEDQQVEEKIASAYRIKNDTSKGKGVWGKAQTKFDFEETLAKLRQTPGGAWADDLDDEAAYDSQALVKHVFSGLTDADKRDMLAILTSMLAAPMARNETVDCHGKAATATVLLQDKAAHERCKVLEKRLDVLEKKLQKMETAKPNPPKVKEVAGPSKPEPVVSSETAKAAEKPKLEGEAKAKSLKVVVPVPAPKPGVCNYCGAKTKTMTELRNHKNFKHAQALLQDRRARRAAKKLTAESAIPHDEDSDMEVKQTSFLEKSSLTAKSKC